MLSQLCKNQYQLRQDQSNIQNITSYLSQQQKMFESERKKASFNQQELSYFVYGGKEKFQAFQNMLKVCSSDPDLKYNPTFLHQSRADMMTTAAKKALSFHKYYPLDGSNQIDKLTIFTHPMPLSLHGLMFLTTLRNLCDQEQQKLFLEPALRGEIIGCYAQTELAHGSDVQNLLTTATYDASSQSFIINTPQIGAAKWWIGDLGLYCNHAVVFAQLIINQKKLGVHAFLVPIRDPNTLLPLKGIQVGDVGPKHGFNIKDNGYAIFNNFRIPRRNMLMRYHVVSKDGAYSLQGNQKISYATMLLTRAGIIKIIANSVARMATIGTRYSLARTQFKDKKGQEIPVLNYQTQQEKILPRIAQAFAFRFIDQQVIKLGNFVFEQSKKGRFDRLNQAHILTSGIKAVLSYDILRGGEIVRRAAGGHGFSYYNGIIQILNQNTPAFTLQGQFTVLLLQVSRYLMKSFMKMNKGKPLEESVKYLEEIKNGVLSVQVSSESLNCPHQVNKILMLHSCGKVVSLGQKFSQLMEEKYTYKQIQDHHAGILLNDAAIAHNHYLLYNNFLKFVQAAKDPKIKAVLTKLLLLFGIEKILERSGKYYETGTIAPESFKLLYSKRESLFEELRPQALSLVECFGYDDSSLMSAIGASNGKPYENLIEWAEKYNTLNRKEERDQIIDTIRKTKAQLKPRL